MEKQKEELARIVADMVENPITPPVKKEEQEEKPEQPEEPSIKHPETEARAIEEKPAATSEDKEQEPPQLEANLVSEIEMDFDTRDEEGKMVRVRASPASNHSEEAPVDPVQANDKPQNGIVY